MKQYQLMSDFFYEIRKELLKIPKCKNLESQEILLVQNDQVILSSDEVTLEEADLQIDKEFKIQLIPKQRDPVQKLQSEIDFNIFSLELLIPQPPFEGHGTIPSYFELSRMSLRQLQQVEDFTIFTEHGQIQFIGFTDVTEVDLAKSIKIKQGLFEVYEGELWKITRPRPKQKLNKPAVVTLYELDQKGLSEANLMAKRFKNVIFQREAKSLKDSKLRIFQIKLLNFETDEKMKESVTFNQRGNLSVIAKERCHEESKQQVEKSQVVLD